MLLWGQPLMKLFVLIVSPSVSFLFEITITVLMTITDILLLAEGFNYPILWEL
jgi:hypothetical protein